MWSITVASGDRWRAEGLTPDMIHRAGSVSWDLDPKMATTHSAEGSSCFSRSQFDWTTWTLKFAVQEQNFLPKATSGSLSCP